MLRDDSINDILCLWVMFSVFMVLIILRGLNLIATTGGVKLSPSAVFAENRLVTNGVRQLFLRHCSRPLGLFEATECIIISTSGFTWPVWI